MPRPTWLQETEIPYFRLQGKRIEVPLDQPQGQQPQQGWRVSAEVLREAEQIHQGVQLLAGDQGGAGKKGEGAVVVTWLGELAEIMRGVQWVHEGTGVDRQATVLLLLHQMIIASYLIIYLSIKKRNKWRLIWIHALGKRCFITAQKIRFEDDLISWQCNHDRPFNITWTQRNEILPLLPSFDLALAVFRTSSWSLIVIRCFFVFHATVDLALL